MKPVQILPQSAYAFRLGVLVFVVLALALYTKGDVKAGVKLLGIELFLETKDAPIR